MQVQIGRRDDRKLYSYLQYGTKGRGKMSNSAAATAVLALLALTSTLSASAASAAKCDSRDVSEAERSFKNCVESAQTGVMQRVSAADADAVDVCNSLDNMLAVCQEQKERLAECKGQAHAQKIRDGLMNNQTQS